ncbi:MAG TPA: hypothetical protein VL986_12690, partial [Terracidiphilus sp.]|nr:hypothetical protein [Terracidiphilus sp.]
RSNAAIARWVNDFSGLVLQRYGGNCLQAMRGIVMIAQKRRFGHAHSLTSQDAPEGISHAGD